MSPRDPFDLFPQLGVERDGAHAFYLGVELARAQVAHQLGKRYVQDNELRWGVAVPPPAEDRLHFVQRRQHAGGAPQGPPGGELMPFIRESIVTTLNADGSAHVAPLGVIVEEPFLVIAPFHPSTTLDNLRRHGFACVNYTTDVRVFAGCVTRRRRDWPVVAAERIRGWRLAGALAHSEVEVAEVVEDELRPSVSLPHRARGRPRALPRASTAPRRRCWRRRSWSRACTCCRPRRSRASCAICRSRSTRPQARPSARRGAG